MKHLNNLRKRALALAVALMMCLSLLPGTASAAGAIPGKTGLGGTVTKRVGETGNFQRLPRLVNCCPRCGRVATEFIPDAYESVNATFVNGDSLTNCGFKMGAYEYDSTAPEYQGYPCFEYDFTGAKVGTATINLYYEYGYYTYTEYGCCDWCGQYLEVNGNQSTYYEKPVITVNVIANNITYELAFNGNGAKAGTVPGTVRDTITITDISTSSDTLAIPATVPEKDGYTFKGWSDGTTTYSADDTVTLTCPSNWTEDQTVSKTLTAVWDEDEPDAPSAPEKEDLYGIMKNFVTVACTSNDAHAVKSYSTVSKSDEVSIGEVQENNGTYTCVVTVDGASYAGFYDYEPAFGTGVEHKLADGEAATKTITLTWNATEGKWKASSAVPVNFNVTCACNHTHVTYTDNKDGTHDGVCDECHETVVDNEAHDYGDDDYCDKCNAKKPATAPAAPDAGTVNELIKVTEGTVDTYVKVTCQDGKHNAGNFSTLAERIQIGSVQGDAANGYTCQVTLFAAKFAGAYSTKVGVAHTAVTPDQTITLVWNPTGGTEGKGAWELKAGTTTPVEFVVKCETTTPGHEHKDENGDGICDDPDCGACLHPHDAETGDCLVEGCGHTGGCCNKGTTPEPPHKHYDDDKDGMCDDPTCGECLHQKNPDGTCIYGDKCQHTDGCCDKGTTTPDPETYTVIFCANGGDQEDVVNTAAENASVSVPTFTREGYTFAGWSTDRAGNQPVTLGTAVTATANAIYYAQWTEDTVTPAPNPSGKITKTIWNVTGAVQSGAQIFYNVVLTNDGDCDLQQLEITDTLQEGLTWMDAAPVITVLSPEGEDESDAYRAELEASYQHEGQIATWTLANFPKGTTITLMYSATVNEGVADGTTLNGPVSWTALTPGDPGYQARTRSAIAYAIGGSDDVTITVCNHTRTHTETVTEATCGQDGTANVVCDTCHEVISTTTTPATGAHTWGETTQTSAPTCTAVGSGTHTCTACGKSESVTIKALGHDMHETTTAATCETGGSTVSACSRCSHSETVATTEALGHDWDGGVVTTPATTTSTGVRTYTCHRDPSHTRTEVIPMLQPENPDPVDPDPVDPNPVDPNPVDPTPTPTPTPDPVPDETDIPDEQAPTDGGTDIQDGQTPLAGAIGLNNVDHFAYMVGYGDGTIHPTANITRAEVATIFFRLMDDEFRSANWATENGFSDVAAGQWFNNAISTSAKAGMLKGYGDGSFRPNQNITRAEFAAMAVRFLSDEVQGVSGGDFKDTAGHWAADAIGRAVAAGWIGGYADGTFRPDEYITRAEAATIINRMLGRVPDAEHLLDDMTVWSDNDAGQWYYAEIQEATNSHAYERDELGIVEMWTALQESIDWPAMEAKWAEEAK